MRTIALAFLLAVLVLLVAPARAQEQQAQAFVVCKDGKVVAIIVDVPAAGRVTLPMPPPAEACSQQSEPQQPSEPKHDPDERSLT